VPPVPPAPRVSPVPRAQPAPAAAAPAPAAAPPEPLEFKAVVLFRSGTFWVGREDRARIAAVAEELRGRTIEIAVEGHADAPGPAAVNQRLSQARARAIGALLEQAGVDPARIALRAFGEERPSDSGEDRRVEVRLRVVR
jgi:outer membrane protein OmpA-like peptidoglycan-associated protein